MSVLCPRFTGWSELSAKTGWVIVLVLAVAADVCLAQAAATVMFATGDVQIVGKDGQTRAAVRGGELNAEETVDTVEGRAQLRFRDGASVSLQTGTRFRVDEFRFVDQGGKAGAEDRGFFSLIKGGFRTLTGLIGKEKREQYKVNAVVATIGIRGTDYLAALSEAGLTVSTFGGLVEVCSDAGCVQVAPGETVVVPDKDVLPRRVGGTQGGGRSAPLATDLVPVKPVESTPVNMPGPAQPAPPTQVLPSTVPTNYPSTSGPNLR